MTDTNKTTNNPLLDAFQKIQKNRSDQSEATLKKYDTLTPNQKFSLWVKHESWCLRNEAIPLIMGVSPDYLTDLKKHQRFNSSIANKIHKLALSCIGDKLSLQVTNPTEKENNWRVHKTQFLKWAISNNIKISSDLLEINEKHNPYELIGESTTKIKNSSYSTPLLKIVEYVISEHWEGLIDYSRVLSKTDMVEHLMKEHELTERDAIAVDVVTRDPSRRNKKIK